MILALLLSGSAVSQIISVPKPEEVQSSPVADAARLGDSQAVVALLQQGLDVNGRGADGTPALHWAVRVNDQELVDVLLAAGADVNGANRYGQTPIHVAVQYRHVDMLRKLAAADADIEATDASGEPPLVQALRLGARDVAEALLTLGAEVDSRDLAYGQTPLMLAVRGEYSDLVQRLLAAGADVNAQSRAGEEMRFILPAEVPVGTSKGVGINRMGWPDRGARQPIAGAKTPLLFATRQGNLALTRLLVEAGADTEIADANGITPLINAIINHSIVNVNRTGQSDHLKIAQYLVEAGANVNAQDWYGQTPLWAAVDIRNLEFSVTETTNRVDREGAYALIESLLDGGADPNSRTREFPPERRFIAGTGSNGWVDMTGQTPFLRAALAGDLRVLRLLLEHGADPNISTYEGTTPLMVAAGVTWAFSETFDEGADALLETVKLTHALGNDINAVNSMGLRAIHGAANRGSNDIISYLAENGARLDVVDNEGRTPIDWAEGVLTGARAPFSKPATIALLQELQAAAAARRD
ncbi:MAG: ankyrin repeat domain-containing protein [Gammaproteobacteria bacterium]|jgi:ankyrin repeat protein